MSEAIEVCKRFGQLMLTAADSPEHFQQMLDLLDPDVRIPVAASLPYGGDHVGPEGFLKMGEGFAKTWNVVDGGTFEYSDAGNGRVLLEVNPTFQSREAGRTVPFRMVEVLTVRDGKIV